MSEEIRLIVWDLDETFWRGTLSEGGITEYVAAHHDLVLTLAQRGIMSSICSKNDHDDVERILTDKGLWDYFIFPSIDWTAKGPRLQSIVDAVQLRPESILFIDDNASNRGEAKAFVPGLMVADETIIGSLLADAQTRGKDDPGLERLKDYKLLEKKAAAKTAYRDVEGFLRGSGIRVTIEYDIEDQLDRIVEIINRTNQLNFTKKRLPADPDEAVRALRTELDGSFERRAGTVRVSDTYGDYGIVGFWAMDGLWGDHRLVHFAFSCRILGMGVEQWVYNKLGAPALTVTGTVASKLDFVPDWINAPGCEIGGRQTERLPSVGLRGGCELEILKHFFSFQAERVADEFIFVRSHKTVWRSHIASMFAQDALQGADARAALERLSLKAEDFDSAILADDGPKIRIISNSADAIVPLYRHKTHGFLVPILEYELEDVSALPRDRIDAYIARWNFDETARDALYALADTLRAEYTVVPPGQLDLSPYYEKAVESCGDDCLLIFLLPPATDGAQRNLLQEEINAKLLRHAASRTNVRCVDMARYASHRDGRIDQSRLHFDREAYHAVFRKIVAIHEDWRRPGADRPPERPGSRNASVPRSIIGRLVDRLKARASLDAR